MQEKSIRSNTASRDSLQEVKPQSPALRPPGGIGAARREVMNVTPPLQGSDALRLQEVLTRYVDSRDGYLQAAKLVPQPGLAESFGLIAQRRDAIAAKVAGLIQAQGTKPDEQGSVE